MHQEELRAIDWPSLVLSPEFMSRLDVMAAKRFVQPVLAQEATTAMLEALAADDWQKLTAFAGKSQPTTFAYSVASRAMEDFARQKFGRPRPPAWLQAQGHGWVRLWYMLCLERQWPQLIQQKLEDEFQPGLLEQAIRTIKQRIPRCGEPGFRECCASELGLEELPDDTGHSLDVAIDGARQQTVLTLLGTLLNDRDAGSDKDCPSETTMMTTIKNTLALDADDQLLLRLSYEDGLSSRKVASLMGTSAGSVQRRLKALREQLAAVLSEYNLVDLETYS